MTIKIEKTPRQDNGLTTDDLVAALKRLKPGLSFVVPFLDNAHRATITAIKLWTGRRFVTRAEKHGVRVSEVESPQAPG